MRKALVTPASKASCTSRVVKAPANGQSIAGGTHNGAIKLWNPTTGKLLRTFNFSFLGIGEVPRIIIKQPNTVWAADISPDSQILASGDSDGKIKLWNLNTGQLIHILEGHSQLVAALAFSSDGQTLISGSHDGTVKIWRVSS